LTRDIRIGLHYNPVRWLPPQAAVDTARALRASGAIDYLLLYDQLVAWFPSVLWTEQNSPLAGLVRDGDSFADPWILSGAISHAVPDLGLAITGDALRRGPAEVLQSALTLGRATNGKAIIQLGAGEVKQAKPFGRRRAEGLQRMEDVFQIIRKMLATDGLVSHDGNIWKYDGAWIGTEKEFVPEFWAMGGGPKLTEIATRYADGFVAICPQIHNTPEAFAAEVKRMSAMLERGGRDPAAFTFALWNVVFLWDDREEFDRVIDNPLLKFQAATLGRLNQRDWRKEGVEPVFPDGWHYALKMLPHTYTEAETMDVVARTPREMVEKFCFKGTPKEVAGQLRGFLDAGATAMFPMDYAPYFLGPQDQQHALERQFELARELKS
jgi:phthiodiolone/phenolphthiodiolone dimycocerosates ketoreductase